DNLHLGVEVGYRLFNGWRDQAGLDGARARETASRMELATVRSQLAFEVVRAFNLIVQAEAMVQSHGAMVSAMDESIRTARVRQQEGLLLASELLDLEVQQAVSRENLSQARHNLALARRVFLNLLGLKEGSGEVSSEGIDAQEMPQPLAAGKRPELLGMEAMLLGAEARVRQARGGNYPAIDGYAGYGTDSGLVTDEAGDSWELGVRLRYNLFDGHRTSAEVGAARAMLAELREQKRKTELAISLEVERATLALTDAEERLRVSEKTVAAAQESARVNRARFKEGLVLAADMIGVETRLTEAMLRRAVNDAARRVAIADLRRAMGLSQFREQPEPPPTTTTP
ncbi:MAG: TolC family protein, partial [Desulfobulbaceae bacterium]|nr:TolC family protein [Desulfobulbaceae bacterium]